MAEHDPHAPALAALTRFYENLSPASLASVADIYAAEATFQDPFNAVQGLPAIRRVFDDMFENLHEPRFRVTRTVAQGDEAFLVWDFRFRFKRWSSATEQHIEGTTHVRFDAQGLIIMHRDYWDAAGELYTKLPVIGTLMRWLRRRISAG